MEYPKDHFSYSAYAKFNECPRRWYFDYVKYPEEKVEIPAFALGIAYHEALAEMYRGKTLEDCKTTYADYLKGKNVSPQQHEVLDKCLDYYYSNIYPQFRSKVDKVEEKLSVDIEGIGVKFEYIIDLKTVDGILVDHKTSGARAPSLNNSDQLDIYSYAYLVKNGRLPREVHYHVAYKSPKKNQVEIKSKMPKLSEVLKTVSNVRSCFNMIENDNLPARRGYHCRYCPFAAECDNLIISSEGSNNI